MAQVLELLVECLFGCFLVAITAKRLLVRHSDVRGSGILVRLAFLRLPILGALRSPVSTTNPLRLLGQQMLSNDLKSALLADTQQHLAEDFRMNIRKDVD